MDVYVCLADTDENTEHIASSSVAAHPAFVGRCSLVGPVCGLALEDAGKPHQHEATSGTTRGKEPVPLLDAEWFVP